MSNLPPLPSLDTSIDNYQIPSEPVGMFGTSGSPLDAGSFTTPQGVTIENPIVSPRPNGSASSSGSIFDKAKSLLGSAKSTVDSTTSNPLYSSRLILLILGVILFGAGLLAFKQTQTVIQAGGKAAGKAAELGVI